MDLESNCQVQRIAQPNLLPYRGNAAVGNAPAASWFVPALAQAQKVQVYMWLEMRYSAFRLSLITSGDQNCQAVSRQLHMVLSQRALDCIIATKKQLPRLVFSFRAIRCC